MPRFILELFQEEGFDLREEMIHAISHGLKLLEAALEDPPKDKFVVMRHNERIRKTVSWHGSIRLETDQIDLPPPRRFYTKAVRITSHCTAHEIDHRKLY